ncbi:protein of unknown function DUF169 [Methanothermus fervidus DSM 2088]|uniref:DUF169 domain-containing protein n=1 Tax=Methanothermus fervidus (strain ATCC 43054 / DSM 2088 / JCM 10308 / V24 S) TaxID=523846 RepID=E3GXF6_METFV|nr:DUF169 domain-containing protein [Methanothermus fervidus]ADP76988.1 protein of unknown function DUF169 [Methanothermus fervidus DSM 2088]
MEIEKFTELLDLKKTPVAIAWSTKKPENIKRGEKSRFCEKIDKVLEGEIFYSTSEDEECFGGGKYTGMKDPKKFPKEIRSGEFLVKLGVHKSVQAVQKSWYKNIAIEYGIFSYILFAPLNKAKFKPDVVIVICNATQAMKLLHASEYDGISTAKGAGASPICSAMAALPYLTGKIVYGFADIGSRKHMKNLDDKDVMVAIPYSQVERIIQNLEEMKDKPIFVG